MNRFITEGASLCTHLDGGGGGGEGGLAETILPPKTSIYQTKFSNLTGVVSLATFDMALGSLSVTATTQLVFRRLSSHQPSFSPFALINEVVLHFLIVPTSSTRAQADPFNYWKAWSST